MHGNTSQARTASQLSSDTEEAALPLSSRSWGMAEAGAELSYLTEFLLTCMFPQDGMCYKEDKTLLHILHPVAFPERTSLGPDSLRTEAFSAQAGPPGLGTPGQQNEKTPVCFC